MARPQKAAAVTHRYDLIGTSDVFTATILLFVNAHVGFVQRLSQSQVLSLTAQKHSPHGYRHSG